jgi:hypothetical protein
MEYAPRLRLIALVDPALVRSPELATLVAKGLIHDFHSLPICGDRLMFSLGHIAGLVALENNDLRAADILVSADQGDAPWSAPARRSPASSSRSASSPRSMPRARHRRDRHRQGTGGARDP